MNRIFQHIRTRQVAEVPEIRPGVVNFNGCILELDALSLHDWVLCEQDPGYRGMPPQDEAVA
ncbi:MAG TPA: hypothetical protein V6D14_10085 [Coleofasciculaceae cyanobacterium]|jgi:hypothetical protein